MVLNVSQCDQDQCIQSTKFVLQAATTPLLHSDPVVLAPLPGKTTTLGGPCAYLAPVQPSLPSCGGDVLTLRDAAVDSRCHHHLHLHHHHHHHHFVSPEETPCATGCPALPRPPAPPPPTPPCHPLPRCPVRPCQSGRSTRGLGQGAGEAQLRLNVTSVGQIFTVYVKKKLNK